MVSASFIAATFSALSLVSAQQYPTANATTTLIPRPFGTNTAKTGVHTVAVGQNGLTFTPDTIIAKPGEEVIFQFFPKNHAVVQSDFNTPCIPNGGIFSGFIPSAAGPANRTFSVKISNDRPVWLYCPQNQPSPHCAAGMVAVINPPTSGPNNLATFKQFAARVTNGSTVPAGGLSGGQVATVGSSSPGPTPSSPPPQSTGAASALTPGGALGAAVIFTGLLL